MRDEDYAVTVWFNKPNPRRPRAKKLSTITVPDSNRPLARPLDRLEADPAYADSVFVDSVEEARRVLNAAVAEQTVVLPVVVARNVLGWTQYDFSEN